MENSQGKTDVECFETFSNNPKKASMEIIHGAHKFIAKVIQDDEPGPTCPTLIKMFAFFTKKPIKSYVFTRMTKPILLELALCIIQDLALNGPARAKNLQLELVDSKSGGKTVKVADQFKEDGSEYNHDFLASIDEAFFKLKDAEGKSPDFHIAAGQGHKASYSPFGKDGAFVRTRGLAARSLDDPIKVVMSLSC